MPFLGVDMSLWCLCGASKNAETASVTPTNTKNSNTISTPISTPQTKTTTAAAPVLSTSSTAAAKPSSPSKMKGVTGYVSISYLNEGFVNSSEEGDFFTTLSKIQRKLFNHDNAIVLIFDQTLKILAISRSKFLKEVGVPPGLLINSSLTVLLPSQILKQMTHEIMQIKPKSLKKGNDPQDLMLTDVPIAQKNSSDTKCFKAHLFVHYSTYNIAYLHRTDKTPLDTFQKDVLPHLIEGAQNVTVSIPKQREQEIIEYSSEEFPPLANDFHAALTELEAIARQYDSSAMLLLCNSRTAIVARTVNVERFTGYSFADLKNRLLREFLTVTDNSFQSATSFQNALFPKMAISNSPKIEGVKPQRSGSIRLEPMTKDLDSLFKTAATDHNWQGSVPIKIASAAASSVPNEVQKNHLDVFVSIIQRPKYPILILRTSDLIDRRSISFPRYSNSLEVPLTTASPTSSTFATATASNSARVRNSPTSLTVIREKRQPDTGLPLEEGGGDGALKRFAFPTPTVSSAHPSQLILESLQQSSK